MISTTTLVVATKLALELILDSSDKLSGLASGANPSQSSWIKSTLGLVQLLKLKLKLFVIETGCVGVNVDVDWLFIEMGLFKQSILGVEDITECWIDKGDGWLFVE